MEEKPINGEVVVTVETKKEFLAELTHRPEVDGLVIEAPPEVGFGLGFNDRLEDFE